MPIRTIAQEMMNSETLTFCLLAIVLGMWFRSNSSRLFSLSKLSRLDSNSLMPFDHALLQHSANNLPIQPKPAVEFKFLHMAYNKLKTEYERLQQDLLEHADLAINYRNLQNEVSELREEREAQSFQDDLLKDLQAENRVLQKNFNKLSANRGPQRVLDLIHRLDRKEQAVGAMHKELEETKETLVAAKSDRSQLETENSRLRAETTELTSQIKAANSKKRQLEEDASELKLGKAMMSIQVRDTLSKRRQLKTENILLKAKNSELGRERQFLVAENRNLKKTPANRKRLEADPHQEAEIAGLRRERQVLLAELQDAKAKSARAQQTLLESQDNERSATAQVKALIEEANSFKPTVQDTGSELQAAKQEVDLLKDKMQNTNDKLQAAEQEVNLLKNTVQDTNNKLQAAKQEVGFLKNTVQDTNNQLQAAKQEVDLLKNTLQDTNDKLQTTKQELKTKESELVIAEQKLNLVFQQAQEELNAKESELVIAEQKVNFLIQQAQEELKIKESELVTAEQKVNLITRNDPAPAPAVSERVAEQAHEQANDAPAASFDRFAANPYLTQEQVAIIRDMEKFATSPWVEDVAVLQDTLEHAASQELTNLQRQLLSQRLAHWKRYMPKRVEQVQQEALKCSTPEQMAARKIAPPRRRRGALG